MFVVVNVVFNIVVDVIFVVNVVVVYLVLASSFAFILWEVHDVFVRLSGRMYVCLCVNVCTLIFVCLCFV